jgi:hypothetical protein
MRASTSAATSARHAPAANARPVARTAVAGAAAPPTTRRRRAVLAPATARDDPLSRRGLMLAGGWGLACGCGCCGGAAAAAAATAAAAAGRNSFYDGYFASQMAGGMGRYEAAIAERKRQLFGKLVAAAAAGRPAADGPLRVLEVGVGTGAHAPPLCRLCAASAPPLRRCPRRRP